LGFLVLWAFLVAAALASACGVAARALWPVLPVPAWAAIHSLVGFVLVWAGRYRVFEFVMQWLIAVMFVLVIVCALPLQPDATAVVRGLFVPTIPAGSAKFLLSVIGGVGGSVTLLCYGYWIRERGWAGPEAQRRSLVDLAVAYSLSGLFGLAMIVIAAEAQPANASGNALVLALAARLGDLLGPPGATCFLVGFWCAVFSSLLGVWQGVPYLFADTVNQLRRSPAPPRPEATPTTRTTRYRLFLAYLAFPPLGLMYFRSPLAIVVLYAITGAFFMPFLASVLLVMNNRGDWVGRLRNGWFVNTVLVLSLALFVYLFFIEAAESLAGLSGRS
jgi:Mn2+/Fe2+ NRAMP family transporter